MRRQRTTLIVAALSVPGTVLLFCALLWPHTSHRGLIVWAAFAIGNTIVHWFAHLRIPLEKVTEARLLFSHVAGGASWATLPWVAMPDQPEWQTMVGTILVAVLAAGLAFTSQFTVPFFGWVISLTGTASLGFLSVGGPTCRALGILMVAAGAFSLLIGAVLRAGDLGASVFAARNADLVDELQAEKDHLRELATTDPLTGISNRLAFSDDLKEGIEGGAGSVALALIDLDGFKQINDSMGHHVGDQVLQAITNRIASSLLSSERLYRIGGDELTVLQHRTPSSKPLEELGQRLISNFAEPLLFSERAIEISASIGIAEVDETLDSDAIQRGADEALYRAKRSPGSGVNYFDAAMRAESAYRDELRANVGAAVTAGHIVPWLQPVVDLRTGEIVGAEALARWEHPDGVRSAASFITALEDAGRGAELDRIIFDAVTNFRPVLNKLYASEFLISLNVSPAFLSSFLDTYEASAQLEGSIIEITEQRDLTNHADLMALIRRAQRAGARVFVDDFGMGFSSMERLSLGSFEGLKIDGSFVQSLAEGRTSTAIVASITEIGRRLDVPVVAEGIETSDQAMQLRDFGVRWGQGYLYSPAVPVTQMAEMLDQQRRTGPYFAELVESCEPSSQLEPH